MSPPPAGCKCFLNAGQSREIQVSWRDKRREICCRRFCSSPHPSVTFDSPRISTTSPSPGEPSTCAQRCPCLFHFDAALPPPASSHTWPIRHLHRPVMSPCANPPGERVRGDDAPYPATKALLHSRPPLLPSRSTFPLSSSHSHSHRHLLTLIVTFISFFFMLYSRPIANLPAPSLAVYSTSLSVLGRTARLGRSQWLQERGS